MSRGGSGPGQKPASAWTLQSVYVPELQIAWPAVGDAKRVIAAVAVWRTKGTGAMSYARAGLISNALTMGPEY